MYKVIVVGTDGSGRAGKAIREAAALAKSGGGTLHVVHAAHTSTTMLSADYVDFDAVSAAKEQMHDEGTRICTQAVTDAKQAGVATQIHSVEGEPAHAIMEVAESVGADLVVVGNRGMTSIKRFVLGSVSSKLSHHCPCNLLIVHTDTE